MGDPHFFEGKGVYGKDCGGNKRGGKTGTHLGKLINIINKKTGN